MTQQIANNEKFRKNNDQLQRTVEGRTAELRRSNLELDVSRQEIKTILEHIPLGILTLNKNKRINKEYSAHVHKLFGKNRDITGQRIEDLFFWEEGSEEDRQSFAEWIDLVFDDTMDWELICELGPTLIEHKTPEKTRYFHNEFKRIMRDGEVDSLMVIVSDITRQKELEATIKEQEKNYGQEMEIISAIVNGSREEFGAYLEGVSQLLQRAKESFRSLKMDNRNIDFINGLFRQMHSLKGHSRAHGMTELSTLAHITEDILSGIRDGAVYFSSDHETACIAVETVGMNLSGISQLLEKAIDVFDKISGKFDLDLGKSRQKKRAVKIDETQVDELLTLLSRLQKNLNSETENLSAITDQLSSKISNLKLMNLNVINNRLETVVDDIAKTNGKEAQIRFDYESIYLDPVSHNEVSNSLLHIIRNAVDHGIETPETREAVGKPRRGLVTLDAIQSESKTIIQVSDDGQGIDSNKILQKCLAKNLISPEKAKLLTREEILRLILLPGFSISDEISHFSGRGVGMDVVLNAANKLKGLLEVQSEPGQGTTITLSLPISY